MTAIPRSDYVMLGKLLALTTSDQDGEALAAIRKANAILARNKLTWASFFTVKKPEPAEVQRHSAEGFTGFSYEGKDPDAVLRALQEMFGNIPKPDYQRRRR